MAKKKKLSLARAVKYYAAGYPCDSFATLDYLKHREIEAQHLIDEVTAFVNASDLQTACTLAVGYGYGVEADDDASNWRSHVEPISAIRKAAGHYELDYSPESIVRDLLELLKSFNTTANYYYYEDEEKISFENLLHSNKELDKRIELVYGRV